MFCRPSSAFDTICHEESFIQFSILIPSILWTLQSLFNQIFYTVRAYTLWFVYFESLLWEGCVWFHFGSSIVWLTLWVFLVSLLWEFTLRVYFESLLWEFTLRGYFELTLKIYSSRLYFECCLREFTLTIYSESVLCETVFWELIRTFKADSLAKASVERMSFLMFVVVECVLWQFTSRLTVENAHCDFNVI